VTTSAATDGRTARRDRNRELVLDAVLALFRRGNFAPAPEAVAEEAGLSLRSVYRYVTSRDQLFYDAIEHHVAQTADVWLVPDLTVGTLSERVRRLVTARMRLFLTVGATNRASRALSLTNEEVRLRLVEARRYLRQQVTTCFAQERAELPDDVATQRFAALDVLLQLEGLDNLLTFQELTPARATDTLITAVTQLLTGPVQEQA
jgi:AcrR family transcriptional regulator